MRLHKCEMLIPGTSTLTSAGPPSNLKTWGGVARLLSTGHILQPSRHQPTGEENICLASQLLRLSIWRICERANISFSYLCPDIIWLSSLNLRF